MSRQLFSGWLTAAWIVCGCGVALADDSSELNLPTELTPATLSKTSAKGAAAASASADAEVTEDTLHANASANATIDSPITVTGPVTTGTIDGLSGNSGQISTGFGNIQQGVQATAISF